MMDGLYRQLRLHPNFVLLLHVIASGRHKNTPQNTSNVMLIMERITGFIVATGIVIKE